MSEPFIFATESQLVEITGRRARNLDQLLGLLREAEDASIFLHTYQSLREHHLLIERYPNDFAEWAHRACGEFALAEQLAAVDLREFASIQELRSRIVECVERFLAANPAARTRPAREPFDLCSSVALVMPTGDQAATLEEFREVIGRCSLRTIYYHFVTARLRLDLATNDFSLWLESSLEQPERARALDRIDLVMRTLDEVRVRILEVLR